MILHSIRTFSLAAFFITFAVTPALSQTKGFHFLRNSVGARPAAMGGAFVAIQGDPYAVAANPAALAGLSQRHASFDYVNSLLDIQTGFGAYSHAMPNSNFTVAVMYHDYGSFEATDAAGNSDGTFSANSVVFTAAYARKYSPQLWFGGAAKYIHSSIANYGSNALAIDLGVYYDSNILGDLKFAAGIYNLGRTTSAFIETKEDLPTRLEAGVSKKLAHLPLEYSIAGIKYLDEDFELALGGEFTISTNLFLRLGYNTIGRDQKLGTDDRFAGISTGFGLVVQKYRLDYAYSSWGTVGSVNRFSFSLAF